MPSISPKIHCANSAYARVYPWKYHYYYYCSHTRKCNSSRKTMRTRAVASLSLSLSRSAHSLKSLCTDNGKRLAYARARMEFAKFFRSIAGWNIKVEYCPSHDTRTDREWERGRERDREGEGWLNRGDNFFVLRYIYSWIRAQAKSAPGYRFPSASTGRSIFRASLFFFFFFFFVPGMWAKWVASSLLCYLEVYNGNKIKFSSINMGDIEKPIINDFWLFFKY